MSDKNVRGFENDIIRDRWRCPGIIETEIGDESSQNEWDRISRNFLDHMIRSKWKFWKIVCCFQANADWFVYNKHHLSTINRLWFKSKISDFWKKNPNFVLTIIKGTTVILNFCLNFGFFFWNRNRILVGIKMIMIPLWKFFLDEPNKKIKTCFSVINWIYQNDFFKITTWKNFRKKFTAKFSQHSKGTYVICFCILFSFVLK